MRSFKAYLEEQQHPTAYTSDALRRHKSEAYKKIRQHEKAHHAAKDPKEIAHHAAELQKHQEAYRNADRELKNRRKRGGGRYSRVHDPKDRKLKKHKEPPSLWNTGPRKLIAHHVNRGLRHVFKAAVKGLIRKRS
jgi:hypothetical protein